MGKPINPIGLIDLTSPQKQEESIERVQKILWGKIWSMVNVCVISAIALIGGNIFYWYYIRNPEQQIVLTTVSLVVFTPFFLRAIKLFIEYQKIQQKIKSEDQKQQTKYFIELAKTFDSKVFRLKTNDKSVLDLQTEMLGFFKSFESEIIDDKSFEIEVKF